MSAQRPTHQPPRVQRRRISWKNLILMGLVLIGVLVYLHMATAKFKWWYQATFAGQVVGKQAIRRNTLDPVPDAQAIEQPATHRFFLDITTDTHTSRHEVVLSVFRDTRIGDHIAKPKDTYSARHTPHAPAPPASPPTPPTAAP